MALFGRKKTEPARTTDVVRSGEGKKEKTVAASASAPSERSGTSNDLSHVLQSPRITEKATMHQEGGVYTFDVGARATKSEVRDAVRMLYGVVPRKICVVSVPSKQKRNVRTGKHGISGGGRKAYVYLKKGETITIT